MKFSVSTFLKIGRHRWATLTARFHPLLSISQSHFGHIKISHSFHIDMTAHHPTTDLSKRHIFILSSNSASKSQSPFSNKSDHHSPHLFLSIFLIVQPSYLSIDDQTTTPPSSPSSSPFIIAPAQHYQRQLHPPAPPPHLPLHLYRQRR